MVSNVREGDKAQIRHQATRSAVGLAQCRCKRVLNVSQHLMHVFACATGQLYSRARGRIALQHTGLLHVLSWALKLASKNTTKKKTKKTKKGGRLRSASMSDGREHVSPRSLGR